MCDTVVVCRLLRSIGEIGEFEINLFEIKVLIIVLIP
jgi:hypothetical protein